MSRSLRKDWRRSEDSAGTSTQWAPKRIKSCKDIPIAGKGPRDKPNRSSSQSASDQGAERGKQSTDPEVQVDKGIERRCTTPRGNSGKMQRTRAPCRRPETKAGQTGERLGFTAQRCEDKVELALDGGYGGEGKDGSTAGNFTGLGATHKAQN